MHPSILGINRVDESVLRRLAGPRGQMTVVKDDGYEIDRGLDRARDLLWRRWEVGFSLGNSREELGRSWAELGARAGRPLGEGCGLRRRLPCRPSKASCRPRSPLLPAWLEPIGGGCWPRCSWYPEPCSGASCRDISGPRLPAPKRQPR